MTQEQLADRSQRSEDTISNLERGLFLPNLETLEALAQALGVDVGDFFQPPPDGADARRVRLEAQGVALVRRLNDRDLAVAVEQLVALARLRDTGD